MKSTSTTCLRLQRTLLLLLLWCAMTLTTHASADSTEHKIASFLSGAGSLIYLGAGVGLPLIEDGSQGKAHALRAADALGTSVLFSEGLKALTREKRPDGSDRESFPSGHATAAFAVATMQTAFHAGQAPYWYVGAALISYSRVSLHKHYLHDVLAGAALGYAVARWEVGARRGLVLTPFIPTSTVSSTFQLNHADLSQHRGLLVEPILPGEGHRFGLQVSSSF